ncbi:DUF1905 domain-containing protein [Enterococcus nangangensis]|uniref:DUF1905 domain-containing protein n=1 Tax=Enterococcus nangangensis TaxID=2559926 RepID=UPI0010F4E015|nr:DUF1905 domain-containing protein [Enterococcus nangangensis]
MQEYQFVSKIYPSEVGKGGAYVIFPYDLRQVTGKGRARVTVDFEGIPYTGSIVNMGVKDAAGEICYILGIRKDIRQALKKEIGASITVKLHFL